jgi:signal peptidase I
MEPTAGHVCGSRSAEKEGDILRRGVTIALGCIVLGAAWLFLAPPALGGQVSWIVVSGISMLPKFRDGDLVFLRRAASYHVGEVAAYYDPLLRAKIMHQIIAVRAGHYFFKGENNSYVDPYHPVRSEIKGLEWFMVPRLGELVLLLRKPVVGAPLLGLIGVGLLSRGKHTRRRRRHVRARTTEF